MKALNVIFCFAPSAFAFPDSLSDHIHGHAGSFGPVDLGYAVHIPTYLNTTLSGLTYATYANIRFAQPPTGELRFQAPVTPPPTLRDVQDGRYPSFSTDCLISVPSYYPFPEMNGTSWGSEDCLFLDVKVPEGITKGDKVPVVHWLFGSGYGIGSKDWSGDPAALFHGMSSSDKKFITVSSNYRLGATGWVSAPGQDMIPNAGIRDALAAVEWTQKYIRNFGGDPGEITVMGESAGGGIIDHLITAWGGKGTVPFQQAILTSPGYLPRVNSSRQMTDLYNAFLKAANCTTVSCLRRIPESSILAANFKLVNNAPPAFTLGPGIGFGPVIDGNLVPHLPNVLLSQGRYHKGIKRVLSSNMANDADFGPINETWPHFLRQFMKTPTKKVIDEIVARYPADPTNPAAPFNNFGTDISFGCCSQKLSKTFQDKAYRYVMSIPPATHALDQDYYFYINNETTPVSIDVPLARRFQRYLRNFIVHGDPNGANGLREGTDDFVTGRWPKYGSEEMIFNITSKGFETVIDPWSLDDRCEFMQSLINDPANGF